MIRETLSKAHRDGVLHGALVVVLVMWGKGLPSPWCWLVLAAALATSLIVIGLNRRLRWVDEGKWPTAYYGGKHFDPLIKDGEENV